VTAVGQRLDQPMHVLAARIISEVLSPIVVIPLGTLIVSVHASGWVRGLAYGAVAVFFAAALPYAVLLSWVRSGKLADRDVRIRQQRPAILALTLCSVSIGLGALWLLNAPRDIFALMAAMLAGMTATLTISTRWKISMHTSCLAGVITSVSLLVSPSSALLSATLLPAAWSRMLLKHHTWAQVLAGTALGVAVAAILLR
jgi:hypothetical protein